jgi:hypothetical protein
MTRLTANTTTPTGTGGYLLTKTDEGQLAFGSPHLFKATASDTGGRFDFIVEEFAPMTGPPLHFHDVQDDTFYILEGLSWTSGRATSSASHPEWRTPSTICTTATIPSGPSTS